MPRNPKVQTKRKQALKTYNKVYKAVKKFAQKNDLQWSIKEVRDFTKKKVYPDFKGEKSYQVRIRDIKAVIQTQLQAPTPTEVEGVQSSQIYYNPLLISPSRTTGILWFGLDDYLSVDLRSEVEPMDLRVEVNAGEYGSTGMFNTDNYNYYSNGVRDIVETIREEFGNESEDAPIFNGVVKLKENQKNKGKFENYFVEYILYIDDEPVSDDTGVEFKLSKRQEKKKDEVQDILKAKIKKLKPEGEVLRKRKVKKEKEKAKKEVEIKPRTATESLSKLLQAITGEEPKKQTNRLQSQLEKIRQQNK